MSEPLEKQPEEKKEEAPDYYDQLLRLKAEFENYRKRVDRDRPELVGLGKRELLYKLIPLYELLLNCREQIGKHLSESSAPDKKNTAQEEMAKGMELVLKELEKFFSLEGVTPIESVGKPYHHDEHEVLGAVEDSGVPEGTVLEEIQKGFKLNGRVLRPARVRIAKVAKGGESYV